VRKQQDELMMIFSWPVMSVLSKVKMALDVSKEGSNFYSNIGFNIFRSDRL